MLDLQPDVSFDRPPPIRRLEALVRYWREKRGDRPVPYRSDIDPLDIPNLLPVVLIADLEPAGIRMRLLGSETTAVYGGETRGRLVADMPFGEFTAAWRRAFALAPVSGEPSAAEGLFTRHPVLYRAALVLMPLAAESGEIRHVFGGLVIRPVQYHASGNNNAPITSTQENIRPAANRLAGDGMRLRRAGDGRRGE